MSHDPHGRRRILPLFFCLALAGWAGCLLGYAAIGSSVAPDGTLVEPFFLVPLSWLCLLAALVLGIIWVVTALLRKRKESK